MLIHTVVLPIPVIAGGVLQDALLGKQTAASLRSALAPKLSGCLNAAAALRHQPMQRQLLFSSVAALLGNAGQSNYAAANAALDAAARLSQQAGLPAASLQWGPWAGGGMATAAVAASLAAKGVGLVQPHSGLQLLGRWMGGSSCLPAVAAPLVALEWGRMLGRAQRQSAMFAELSTASPTSAHEHPARAAASAAVSAALSVAQVQKQVLQLAAGVTGSSMDALDAFMSAGLDSLGELGMGCGWMLRFWAGCLTSSNFARNPPLSPCLCRRRGAEQRCGDSVRSAAARHRHIRLSHACGARSIRALPAAAACSGQRC